MTDDSANQSLMIQTLIPQQTIQTIIDMTAEKVFRMVRPLLCPSSNTDEIFDVKGLAAYLKSTEAWIREQARNGNIPCFKSGKQWKFRKRQIDKLYQSRALLPVSTASIKARG